MIFAIHQIRQLNTTVNICRYTVCIKGFINTICVLTAKKEINGYEKRRLTLGLLGDKMISFWRDKYINVIQTVKLIYLTFLLVIDKKVKRATNILFRIFSYRAIFTPVGEFKFLFMS